MRNRVLLFFVVFIAFHGGLTAQSFKGGVTMGLAASQVAGDGYWGFNKAGIFAGGWVNFDYSEHFSLQLELTYFQKGSRHNPNYEKNPADFPYIFRADYIELPLLLQYKTGRFIIETGPSMGVLIHYYEASDQLIISDKENANRPTQLTFQVNLGMQIVISDRISAGLRANSSLLNIRQKNVTGDARRLFWFGQFNDALVIAAFYRL
jgi:hypothetical protein